MPQSKFSPSPRQYFKRNYVKVLEIFTPKFYLDEEYQTSGFELDPISELINCHIKVANKLTQILPISAAGSISSINTPQGASQYFIKQNKLSEITPFDFNQDILAPLGYSTNSFDTSGEFSNYLEVSFLPHTQLNNPTLFNHNTLADSLSWLYFLNLSGAGRTFEPSSFVRDILVEKTYLGKNINLNDCLRGLTKFCWHQRATSAILADTVPVDYLSGANTYLSGTQQLDKLLTLVDIVYSPAKMDEQDFKVRDAFLDYFTLEEYLRDETLAGPFFRFLRGLSFALADVTEDVDKINLIYDINECPEQFLPLVAELIGWKLFGHDPERWRLQLRTAVQVYKAKGTKRSIQYAADSIFSPDAFNVSSRLTELYESYIPYLMYYALATESPFFKDLTSWTRELASKVNIPIYSTSSLDENIRIVIDKIILDLYLEFPDRFQFGNRPFNGLRFQDKATGRPYKGTLHQHTSPPYAGLSGTIKWFTGDTADRHTERAETLLTERELQLVGDPKFIFEYRGRRQVIPPFDDERYYKDCEVSDEVLERIVEKLKCFGVRPAFADDVGNYIKENTLTGSDIIKINNGWLLFSSGIQYPTNWSDVIRNSNRVDLLSLWNGKSSHFQVTFDSSEFDFSKNTLETDSGVALFEAARVVREFSPAHAIPVIALDTQATSVYTASDVPKWIVNPNKNDIFENSIVSGRAFSKSEYIAIPMSGWHRNASAGTPFNRESVDNLQDFLLSSTISGVFHRNTLIRRNYKNTLPTFGYYSRDGFNAPLTWAPSAIERSYTSSLGYLPLGWIPSSMTFVPIRDYVNLPPIYDRCQTLGSSSVFSGLSVSNTFPCRGLDLLTNQPDFYQDRGQLDELVGLMHRINEDKKLVLAAHIVSSCPSAYPERYWKNVSGSMANLWTLSSTEGIGEYNNFGWGRELTKYHTIYRQIFNNHSLRPDLWSRDGGRYIIQHTFGAINDNSKFRIDGSAAITYGLIASSTSSITPLTILNVFTASGVASGTTVASTVGSLVYATQPLSSSPPLGVELRNPHIVSGLELILTSGIGDNSFTVYKINVPKKNSSEFFNNHTLIKFRSIDGLPRIRVNLRDYFEQNNLLIGGHDYELSISGVVAEENGASFGGASLGVLIHTKVEDQFSWYYTPRETWEMINTNEISKPYVLDNLTHYYNFPLINKETDSSGIKVTDDKQCLASVSSASNRENPFNIFKLEKSDFSTIKFNFNTNNSFLVPTLYTDVSCFNQVHRPDQNYIVEVFLVPSQRNQSKFLAINSIMLKDLTLEALAKVYFDLSGVCHRGCVNLGADDLNTMLRFFNDRRLDTASRRVVSLGGSDGGGPGQEAFGTSGMSRINYRTITGLVASSTSVSGNNISIVRVLN